MRLLKNSALLLVLVAFSIQSYAACPLLEDNKTLLVTTNQDGYFVDECSLREAVETANDLPEMQFIMFSPVANGTILLNEGEIVISDDLHILGNNAHKTKVDAQQQSRIFNIVNNIDNPNGDNQIYLSKLTLQNGLVLVEADGTPNPPGGGAILVNADNRLEINKVVITGSIALPLINNNEPLYAAGGAIEYRADSRGKIGESTLAYNASYNGSAVMIDGISQEKYPASILITQSLIANNTITDLAAEKLPNNNVEYKNTEEPITSGAIHSAGRLSLLNSTIIGNKNNSGEGAGVLYTDNLMSYDHEQLIFKLKFNTITDNIASYKGRNNVAGLIAYYANLKPQYIPQLEGYFGADITNNIIAGNYPEPVNKFTPPDSKVFAIGNSIDLYSSPNGMHITHEPSFNIIGVTNSAKFQLFSDLINKIGSNISPKIPEFEAFEFYNTNSHLIGHLPLSPNDTLAVDNNENCGLAEEIMAYQFDQKGTERGMICDAGASELEN